MALTSLDAFFFILSLLLLFPSPSVSDSATQFCSAGRKYGVSSCGVSSTNILIKGSTVVNAHHQQLADVYVEDGIIVSVQPNIKVGDEVTVLDATGKFVMPGGIDPHTHLALEFMGTETIDDFFSGQAAALAGGTTMRIGFVIPVNGNLVAGFEAYENKSRTPVWITVFMWQSQSGMKVFQGTWRYWSRKRVSTLSSSS